MNLSFDWKLDGELVRHVAGPAPEGPDAYVNVSRFLDELPSVGPMGDLRMKLTAMEAVTLSGALNEGAKGTFEGFFEETADCCVKKLSARAWIVIS